MEKTKKSINDNIHQNGGRERRSTKVLVSNDGDSRQKKKGKENTYMIFADAEKCFNKLWLEDCLKDINKKSKNHSIETPVGAIEAINAEEIVKLGKYNIRTKIMLQQYIHQE